MNSDEQFKKVEALLLSRGLEFTPPMRYNYFNDPMFKAIFTLLLELIEKTDWDPHEELWKDF